ncbi:MAG: CDP-alcohol phosphatidyltransferase family protein [Gemmatimonadetes bacterium]|jgi:hypothetical protein|nr:CDP-alcohol phosphatidyltransferase family protein [Gemmatimonadota bacterium]MBT5056310.1 CDP-alcohol phosphatidyltransferase family protein [Gemmatimonadota bacterium]MBT5145080.1 CDP-alcohol phosphatidyltransferase family protein [Gemmatimonadota bacterium]MBT5586894.1 CDP-alcohol phosphatidyltransferase family protein [Gemmatimonadota bacterium]MBT5965443.1 CDP-alcohol phosphatidyltransferase family protein [Gemmatimonadota bacterium]
MIDASSTQLRPQFLLVDATRPAATWTLWGMSLTERLLRQVSLLGIEQVVVLVSQETAQDAVSWRPDLQRLHSLRCDTIERLEQLEPLVAQSSGGFLLAQGDVVHDDRLLQHLLQLGPDHCVAAADATVAWLSAGRWRQRLENTPDTDLTLSQFVGGLPATSLAQMGDYVPELRLTMTPFMIRVSDATQLRDADHLLYRRTFKGVIDAIARYGYYHLVRFLTRALSRTTLSPNLFTVLSIAGIWLAIPLFATGHLALGCVSAWAGVLLDSIDGKLARLTLNLSDAMGTIEHLSAMPGLGLWFVALGWHFTDGRLLTPSVEMIACWTTLAAFLIDKVISGAFRQHFSRELFDARPLDALFHLVAVRRNMHLLILTIGVVLGTPQTALVAMAVGMLMTLGVHISRFAWIGLTGGVARDTTSK